VKDENFGASHSTTKKKQKERKNGEEKRKETNSLKTFKIFGLGFDLIAVWDIWDHCQHFDRSRCP